MCCKDTRSQCREDDGDEEKAEWGMPECIGIQKSFAGMALEISRVEECFLKYKSNLSWSQANSSEEKTSENV